MVKKVAAVVMAMVLVAVFGLMTPSTTQAGWNGQQISLQPRSSGVNITSITITGKNQNNAGARYSQSFSLPGIRSFSLSGWWWKGDVTVSLGLSIPQPGISKTISCTVSVPTWQSGDWVTVYYDGSRCSR